MTPAEDGSRADELACGKILGEIGAVRGVELVVEGKVGAGNLDVHEIVHGEAGLGQKSLVGVEEQLDLVFDFFRGLSRFRVETDISGNIKGIADKNGTAEGRLR